MTRRPPAPDVDAAPNVRSRPAINEFWIPHVLAVLAPLARAEYWNSSDDEENQFAANEIERLMLALVTHVEDEPAVTVPIGTIVAYAEYGAPAGWLPCDGRQWPIADYPALAALLGTRYGSASAGNFRVPNLRERVAVGVEEKLTTSWAHVIGATGGTATHALTVAELPPHQHAVQAADAGSRGNRLARTNSATGQIDFNTVLPSGAAEPHENRQPYLVVNYIIRAL